MLLQSVGHNATIATMDVLRRFLPAARVQRVGSDIGSIVAWPLRRWLIAVAAARSYWAPLQPLLGALGIMVLLTGLTVRLRHQARCPVPAR